MRPKILNGYEKLTFDEIKRVSTSSEVFPKVRVADVLEINNSGLSNADFEYALKAHFDFVVCNDSLRAEFCVEFDGPSHLTKAQRLRDEAKLRICEKFGFPILRITSAYLNNNYRNNLSLLSWIIEVYFLEKAFDQAQQNGQIPPDEVFDPFFVISDTVVSGLDAKNQWPYQLALEERHRLARLARQKKILDGFPTGFVGFDRFGNLRGCELLRIDEMRLIYVESAMRPQHFPVDLVGLLDELLIIQLSEKVQLFLKTGSGAEDFESALRKTRSLQKRIRLATSHGSIEMLTRIGKNFLSAHD